MAIFKVYVNCVSRKTPASKPEITVRWFLVDAQSEWVGNSFATNLAARTADKHRNWEKFEATDIEQVHLPIEMKGPE